MPVFISEKRSLKKDLSGTDKYQVSGCQIGSKVHKDIAQKDATNKDNKDMKQQQR